jgi:hypothetical protein|tara:strand:+ start:3749 stop:4504 length:756 start_codon:yes stop_codon:yes gene_type:complete
LIAPDLYNVILVGMFALAPVVCVLLFCIDAPYGRFARRGWGPGMDNRTAWLLMESPACLLFAYYLLSVDSLSVTLLILFLMWEVHYVHRAFIYPLTIKGHRRMPVVIMLMAVCFNVVNAYLNGSHLASHADQYTFNWLLSPLFVIGCTLFVIGFTINKISDEMLRRLRQGGDSGYQIPEGFLYQWVSCPNYLGEMIQWIGWAVACWSLAGLLFALWTIANLLPRARAYHAWYQEHFEQFPKTRTAVIPYLY